MDQYVSDSSRATTRGASAGGPLSGAIFSDEAFRPTLSLSEPAGPVPNSGFSRKECMTTFTVPAGIN